ncbi:hypothetical protein HII17_07245 [Thalassotalea sp. M1531]|uniref:Uncharacterized protein n=1 Tax=Thalassotalea algicola TaxID=2716224 RepID=A0A7Y0Q6Z8_9GAMM|nr:hypothetical protein [Thalassotalea algicola]NMP31352.1 hypothetical protein [Thalassotalea algicola]
MQAQLTHLFSSYIGAFASLDVNATKLCYRIPCILSTPDKTLLITTDAEFEQEFSEIFSFLSQNTITGFKASNASYQSFGPEQILVSIDWQFLDKNESVIADFCAVYQLTQQANQFKISHVSSIGLEQSLSLENQLTLNVENN